MFFSLGNVKFLEGDKTVVLLTGYQSYPGECTKAYECQ